MSDAHTRIARGVFGAFEGPASDQVVLPRYEADGSWSRELMAVLEARLGEGGTLIDAGAHVGLISVPIALRTRARVIAIEPAPLNAECLRRNARHHGVAERIALHELALSDEAGEVMFRLCSDNSGDHHVLAAAPADNVVRVRGARLDDVITASALPKPIVLKLDLQGAEVKALIGAARTLPHVAAVVLEYWPAGVLRAGDQPELLEALLSGFASAALLRQDGTPLEHKPRAELFHALRGFMAHDGSDEGFFDLLLTSGRERDRGGS
jgi:FkbM family methyltransferase